MSFSFVHVMDAVERDVATTEHAIADMLHAAVDEHQRYAHIINGIDEVAKFAVPEQYAALHGAVEAAESLLKSGLVGDVTDKARKFIVAITGHATPRQEIDVTGVPSLSIAISSQPADEVTAGTRVDTGIIKPGQPAEEAISEHQATANAQATA